MPNVVASSTFTAWLSGLKDRTVRARIAARIVRLQAGNPGDVAPVGDGVSELRMHFGAGFRVYFMARGEVLIMLLAGGTKATQAADIAAAKAIAAAWE